MRISRRSRSFFKKLCQRIEVVCVVSCFVYFSFTFMQRSRRRWKRCIRRRERRISRRSWRFCVLFCLNFFSTSYCRFQFCLFSLGCELSITTHLCRLSTYSAIEHCIFELNYLHSLRERLHISIQALILYRLPLCSENGWMRWRSLEPTYNKVMSND